MANEARVRDRNLFFGWQLGSAVPAGPASIALRSQVSPNEPDFRNATAAEELAYDLAQGADRDDRLPLRSRLLVITGLALLSWAVVGGLFAWLL